MTKTYRNRGFFVLCDFKGTITEIMVNSFGEEMPLLTGNTLHGIVHDSSIEKLLNFLLEVRKTGLALNWEVTVNLHGGIEVLQFNGVREKSRILLIASSTQQVIFDEIMKINNEQINLFRSFIKPIIEQSLSKPPDYSKIYDEMSMLNNELVNTQRELFKKNSELSRLNNELHYTMNKLKISNQELNTFASVISHDLKNPLVTIISFLSILNREMNEEMNDRMRMLTRSVNNTTERMLKMIDDLLNYSRLSRAPVTDKAISVEQVIRDVTENLNALIAQNNARLTHDPLPVIIADEGQMVRLFQNLIQNALRYRRDEPPQIHIGAGEDPYCWTFSVKDNGMGIDAKNHEKIFQVFKMLRNHSEGTGIGLSICKKIVENHGGRIRVESELNKGSTFIFTISRRSGERINVKAGK